MQKQTIPREDTIVIQRLSTLFILVLAFTLFGVSESASQNQFAVVDMREIFDNSEKFQTLLRQAQVKVQDKAEEYAVQEQAINAEIEDLKQKRTMMEPEALQEQLRSIAQRGTALMEEKMRTMRSLHEEREEAVIPLIEELKVVIEGVAQEEGYTLVLNKRYLVYADPSIDITDKVLAQLNQ